MFLALNRRLCHIDIPNLLGHITVVHPDDNLIMLGGEAGPHHILVFSLITICTIVNAGIVPSGFKPDDLGEQLFGFLNPWKVSPDKGGLNFFCECHS